MNFDFRRISKAFFDSKINVFDGEDDTSVLKPWGILCVLLAILVDGAQCSAMFIADLIPTYDDPQLEDVGKVRMTIHHTGL